MTITRYSSDFKNQWNDFLKNAKNYHFFFHRDFLAYHKECFTDYSLMFYDDKNKLIALLPANRQADTLYSHQGLTYGGFIVNDNMKAATILEIFENTKAFLRKQGITTLIYKTIPHFHHKKPAEEDRYALFRQNATLIQRDLGAVIDRTQPIKYSNGRKWSLKKAKAHPFTIRKSTDFTLFWPLLEEILQMQHGSKPVHSLDEINYLANTFPDNIHLYLIYHERELLAGAVTFVNPDVVHLQYVANSIKGRKIGALDLLIDHLIQHVYTDKRYFDFGTSNEQNGRILNEGLIDQKERFGARCIVNDRYEWKLT